LALCLRAGADPSELKDIFEDVDSELHQAGKFKIESVHTNSRFKHGKAYSLGGKLSEPVARMRGIPMKCKDLLGQVHYGQNPITSHAVVHSVQLRPTDGLEMVMERQSRTLSVAFNMKRKATVRKRATWVTRWQFLCNYYLKKLLLVTCV
jgi:hypothetical protein